MNVIFTKFFIDYFIRHAKETGMLKKTGKPFFIFWSCYKNHILYEGVLDT